MQLSKQQFEQLVAEAIDGLPEKIKNQLNNVAIFVEDNPSREQLTKLDKKGGYTLFGLFEGYAQARRLNFGPVLPDRITIFRQPILNDCRSREDCRQKIISTVRHEIAHHFGSDESGASQASQRS